MTNKVHMLLAIFAVTILVFGCISNPLIGPKKNNTTPSGSTNQSNNNTPPPKPAIEEKWSGVQMKFTFVGSQEKLIPSVGVSVKETPFDITKFQKTTADVDYSNDDIAFKKIEITKDEMQNAVTSAFGLEFMSNPKASDNPAVSFMLYNATSGTTTEYLLTASQGKVLAGKILGALTESKKNVTAVLSGYG